MRIGLVLAIASIGHCGPDRVDYGDRHTQVDVTYGFYWPATGKVVQGFYGTDSETTDAETWFDEYGQRQYFAGGSNFHRGVDIENARGTKVYAAHSGTVTLFPWDGSSSSGHQIVIKDASGYCTIYSHLDRYAVEQGAWATPNTVIGYMGSSGNQDFSHLHFGYGILYRGELCRSWTPGDVGQMVTSGEPLQPPTAAALQPH